MNKWLISLILFAVMGAPAMAAHHEEGMSDEDKALRKEMRMECRKELKSSGVEKDDMKKAMRKCVKKKLTTKQM